MPIRIAPDLELPDDVVTQAIAILAEEIAEAAGYSAKSSGYGNALGRLRTLGLIEGLRPSEDLV